MNAIEKRCLKCGETKQLSLYYRRKDSKDGFGNTCCLCKNNQSADWRKKHPVESKMIRTKFYKNHPNYVRDDENRKIWVKNNSQLIAATIKKWRYKNPEKVKAYCKKWASNNPEKIKERRARWQYKLKNNMGRSLFGSLRENKQGTYWETLVGYTVNDLKKHLESLWKIGMTWENYGKYGWHIDHIIPISRLYFDSVNDPTFKFAWSLGNLQPLWAKDNLSKNNKIAV
jgi:hypothetical protein